MVSEYGGMEGKVVLITGGTSGIGKAAIAKIRRSTGILLFRAFMPFMRSPEQGADTVIYLASSPEAEQMNGKYLTDREQVSPRSPATR